MSTQNHSLTGKKILVTGATGFVGGCLARRLAEVGAAVTGTGRSTQGTEALASAGVAVQPLDLASEAAVEEIVAGQEIIFNLAAWMSRYGDVEMAPVINVTAVENLVRLAAAAGVRRVIHISSIAAYGRPDARLVTEDHPLDLNQEATYGRTKAQGEERARLAAEELGVELVIVRPGMIYGPGSIGWSANMLRMIRRRMPVIYGDGGGHAQPVYIDNLLDLLVLTAVQPQAAGQTFNAIDGPVSWREFFGYYGQMAGRRPLRLPLWLARPVLSIGRRLVGRTESTATILSFYTNQVIFSMDRAEQLLGYRPAVTLAEGMRRTEAWLREAGYLDQ